MLSLVPAREASSIDPIPLISADLIAASYRSDTFPRDWTQQQRETSLARYEKWLRLKLLHPKSRLAPTLDIDLFWHLHMLSPVAYYRDCMRLFGRLLDHDGGFGKGPGELEQLKSVFLRTEQWWEEEYGAPYRVDGTRARDAIVTDCWHDCEDRCWHACSDIN